jgi:hypothetical protein
VGRNTATPQPLIGLSKQAAVSDARDHADSPATLAGILLGKGVEFAIDLV